MAQKINQLTSAPFLFTADAESQTHLINLILHIQDPNARRVVLPEALIEEIEDFTERNSLVIIAHTLPDRIPIHRCCPQCLKAHILHTAQDLKLDKNLVRSLSAVLNCGEGHNGFYLDEGRLIKSNH